MEQKINFNLLNYYLKGDGENTKEHNKELHQSIERIDNYLSAYSFRTPHWIMDEDFKKNLINFTKIDYSTWLKFNQLFSILDFYYQDNWDITLLPVIKNNKFQGYKVYALIHFPNITVEKHTIKNLFVCFEILEENIVIESTRLVAKRFSISQLACFRSSVSFQECVMGYVHYTCKTLTSYKYTDIFTAMPLVSDNILNLLLEEIETKHTFKNLLPQIFQRLNYVLKYTANNNVSPLDMISPANVFASTNKFTQKEIQQAAHVIYPTIKPFHKAQSLKEDEQGRLIEPPVEFTEYYEELHPYDEPSFRDKVRHMFYKDPKLGGKWLFDQNGVALCEEPQAKRNKLVKQSQNKYGSAPSFNFRNKAFTFTIEDVVYRDEQFKLGEYVPPLYPADYKQFLRKNKFKPSTSKFMNYCDVSHQLLNYVIDKETQRIKEEEPDAEIVKLYRLSDFAIKNAKYDELLRKWEILDMPDQMPFGKDDDDDPDEV